MGGEGRFTKYHKLGESEHRATFNESHDTRPRHNRPFISQVRPAGTPSPAHLKKKGILEGPTISFRYSGPEQRCQLCGSRLKIAFPTPTLFRPIDGVACVSCFRERKTLAGKNIDGRRTKGGPAYDADEITDKKSTTGD